MRISAVELVDFRNYDRFLLSPSPELTILVGPNAVGKTNVIEAIQLLTSAKSFRRPRWDEVVRWGADRAMLRVVASGDSPTEVRLDIGGDGKRVYRVNGSVRRRVSDVSGILPSVVFTPEDLDMVKGPAETRRELIDALGEQLSSTYGALRRDYSNVVRSRNRLLRDAAPEAELEPWSLQLVEFGARLTEHRIRLLHRVSSVAAEVYEELSGGETLEIGYVSGSVEGSDGSGPGREAILRKMVEQLEQRRGEERARLTTLIGPHRDDVVFTVSGRDARAYASQGQQRTIAIAWKLAEVRVIESIARRQPVLLLDDVMSELDSVRRRALTEVVQRHVQTFVTTTNLDYFDRPLLERALVVELPRRSA